MERTIRYSLACLAFVVASWASFAEAATDEELEVLVEDAVLDAAPWQDARVSVENVRVVGKMPKGTLAVKLRSTRRLYGKVRAELVGENTTTWLTADVEVFVLVMVATADHRRGDRVSFAPEERAASTLPRNFVWDARSLEGVVARRSIRSGDVIGERDVEAPVAVERNQLVTVVVRRGAVVVTARGVALQSGRIGDVVRIRNMASKAVTDAVAVRPGTVEVP